MTNTEYQRQQWFDAGTEQLFAARSDAATPSGAQHRGIDQGRFWVGAILTAAVAALAGVIGLVVAQNLLRIPISLGSIGVPGDHIGSYAVVAGIAALLAAAAYDGMLAYAPRPTVYFGAICGLLTALAALLPFTTSMSLGSQAALAAINLVVGVLIMTLVPVAASNARPQV